MSDNYLHILDPPNEPLPGMECPSKHKGIKNHLVDVILSVGVDFHRGKRTTWRMDDVFFQKCWNGKPRPTEPRILLLVHFVLLLCALCSPQTTTKLKHKTELLTKSFSVYKLKQDVQTTSTHGVHDHHDYDLALFPVLVLGSVEQPTW